MSRKGSETGPICPICRAETDTYYLDVHGELLGCPECIREADAYEVEEERREEGLWDYVDNARKDAEFDSMWEV